MSPVDLNNLPEPQRATWVAWGLTGHNAEIEVERLTADQMRPPSSQFSSFG